jgi:4,5-DOPA dioxygenase extradiol
MSIGELMPAYFLGHGSPMNGIEDNEFSNVWKSLALEIPRPKAILCISAHWMTKGTAVTAMERPPTIHDFGGFPQALFDAQYPAPGSAEFAREIQGTLPAGAITLDTRWGLDHGTWTVLKHIYPAADIPVLQLSLDIQKPGPYHYDLGKQLAGLRRQGYLILGSGNMVHNLRLADFSKPPNLEFGFDWALEINAQFKAHILSGNHDPLIHYEKLGPAAKLAIPTPEHYYPLLYILGMQSENTVPSFFNDKAVAGALTMTSVRL